MPRFSVIGSCISRDLFPINDPNYTFHTDVRFVSPFTLVSESLPQERNVNGDDFANAVATYGTNWYIKNLCNDINKTAFSALDQIHGDYLVVDLADARIPVCKLTFPDSEKEYFVSNSLPFRAQYQANLKFNKLSDVDMTLLNPRDISIQSWIKALEIYAKKIGEIFDYSHVILIKNFCVAEYLTSSGTLKKFSDAEHMDMIYTSNLLFDILYTNFEKMMPGCNVIDIPLFAMADETNKWGKHPLHMTPTYYAYLLDSINAIVESKKQQLPQIYARYASAFKLEKQAAELMTERGSFSQYDHCSFTTSSSRRYSDVSYEKLLKLHAVSAIYTYFNTVVTFGSNTHYGINNQLIKDFLTEKNEMKYDTAWFHPAEMKEGFHVIDSLSVGSGCTYGQLKTAFSDTTYKSSTKIYIGEEYLPQIKKDSEHLHNAYEVMIASDSCDPVIMYMFTTDSRILECDKYSMCRQLIDRGEKVVITLNRITKHELESTKNKLDRKELKLIDGIIDFRRHYIKELKISCYDCAKLFVFSNIFQKAKVKFTPLYHYCIHNIMVNLCVSGYSSEKVESTWLSPASFSKGTLLLDLNKNYVKEVDDGTESDALISMFNSTQEEKYVILSESLIENMTFVNDEVLKYLRSYKIIINSKSEYKELYIAFFSKDKKWLSKIADISSEEFYFSDVDFSLRYEPSERFEEKSGLKEASRLFLKSKSKLLGYLASLTNQPVVTPGLELVNRRALDFFDTMYNFDDLDTLADRKAMFRQMQKPSSGSIVYTQKGSSFLLKKLDQLCRKHGINYWMYNGSLLGACRHGTFIPWDDDIDVGIMRSDIKRLQDLIKDDPYFSIDIFYNLEEADRIYKFRFKNTDLPNYVDIFPFDYCEDKNGDTWNKLKVFHASMVQAFRKKSRELDCCYRSTFSVKPEHLEIFNALFDEYTKKIENELGITDKPCKNIIYGFDTCYIVWWPQVYEVEKVFPLSTVNFDGTDFLAFGNAEEILVKNYKRPYTLPKDIVSHRHTARVYETQIEKLENLMQTLKDYNFDKIGD